MVESAEERALRLARERAARRMNRAFMIFMRSRYAHVSRQQFKMSVVSLAANVPDDTE